MFIMYLGLKRKSFFPTYHEESSAAHLTRILMKILPAIIYIIQWSISPLPDIIHKCDYLIKFDADRPQLSLFEHVKSLALGFISQG